MNANATIDRETPPINKVLAHLQGVKQRNKTEWQALCPCHDDNRPSLSVKETEEGKVLLHCFTGCTTESIVSALNLDIQDLFISAKERFKHSGDTDIIAVYNYTDVDGNLIYQKLRKADKKFLIRRRDSSGNWIYNKDGLPDVLYNLPKVREAVQSGSDIFFCEGEKDTDALTTLGLYATTSGGVNSWRHEFAERFQGVARVIVVRDNDEEGRIFGNTVAQALQDAVKKVVVLDLPNLPEKGDVSDWLAKVGSKEKLIELAEVAPKWTPKLENKRTTHETYNLTDLGNAQRLVAQHKADLRYCHPWKRWLVWDGTRWALDATGEVFRRAKDTVRHIYNEAAQAESKDERQKLAQHAMKSESEHRLNAMINLAKSEPGIPVLPEELDCDAWLLNVQNGTVNLREGLLYPHRREDMITKLAPVVYDPSAQCATWDAFLDRIMGGNQELIDFIQRVVGYALTGSVKEQKLCFLNGHGCNGKSTLLNTLQALLGDYAKQVDPELLLLHKGEKHPTSYADLFRTRLAVCVEIEEGKRLAEVMTKQLTGGDRIAARRMRQDFFEFEPTHKIFLAANHKPIVRGTDLAIWRRIDLIPFNVTIPEPEQDKNLLEKLKCELSGILNWALIGCLDWQEKGLREPDEVKAATSQYRSEMDLLGDFLGDCCQIGESYGLVNKELRTSYVNWCDDNGIKPISDTAFSLRLQERGFIKHRTGRDRSWRGLRLKTGICDRL